ncbi:MAG TPA: TIGR02147 family protein [bacterium]|nr:TIGR02147 family protein [bacterium]
MSIPLFEYFDYRHFLRDRYQALKANRRFSYRLFARRAGFRSSNIFKLVMEGRRNLTEKSSRMFAKGLRLNRSEGEYFRELVLFNQADTHEEKNERYRQLLRMQCLQGLEPLERDRHEYYSAWYHPVVRELVVARDFDGTAKWIAARLDPAVGVAQVNQSIRLLQRLGFIEKTAEGRWRQASPLVSSGAESDSAVLLHYHRSVLEILLRQAGSRHPSERDISALTLGIHRSRVSELKRRVQEFRREILQLVSEDHEPEEVVILGIQLLPVTQGKAAS